MENMINVVKELMMEDTALGDCLDEEGLLCCGNCHTRKQAMNEKPIMLGDRIFVRHPLISAEEKRLRRKRQNVSFVNIWPVWIA